MCFKHEVLRRLDLIENRLDALAQAVAGVQSKLDSVLSGIALLKTQGEKLMALADDLKASIAKLDAETTSIASLITALAAKVHNGMTDAEVADVNAAFATLSARLTTLGVDPTNPVPPPPPALAALAKKVKP
jgi:chromosome segregation ATPase